MERYAGVGADIEGAVCDRVVDVLGGGADAFPANGVEQNELITARSAPMLVPMSTLSRAPPSFA